MSRRWEQDELVKFRLHNMSMVFQSFALMPHLTVLENAAFGLELAKVEKENARNGPCRHWSRWDLPVGRTHIPTRLSGGMQQRVGLARGLAVDPDILLMDEAFSALDPLIRTEMQDELLKLRNSTSAPSSLSPMTWTKPCASVTELPSWKAGGLFRSEPRRRFSRIRRMIMCGPFSEESIPPMSFPPAILSVTPTPPLSKPKVGSLRAAHELLSGSDRDYGYVLDANRRFLGMVSSDSLREAIEDGASDNPIDQAYIRRCQAGECR